MLDKIPTWILVALGGMLGTLSRYGLSGLFKNTNSFPLGTLIVNTLGSFFLGFFIYSYRLGIFSSALISFLGIGFFGAFTTMSTFAVETTSLFEQSSVFGVLNIVVMIAFVLLGSFSGSTIALFIYKKTG